jgi:hypothetical protein
MIKKSFLACLLIFITYSGIFLFRPQTEVATHQWQENMIKAQKYLYSNQDTIRQVILGTSLACCILKDSIPDHYNMAFSGLSIYDGLNVIRQKKTLPESVFIETNYTLKAASENFSDDLFSPVLFPLRKYLVSLRDGRQPLAIAGIVLRNVVSSLTGPEYNSNFKKKEGLFDKMLKIHTKEYTEVPDNSQLNEKYSVLKKQVDFLKQHGVKVVFFEMPVNPALADLPKAKITRETLHRYFPASDYQYIAMPECSGYVTGDGVHINLEEAKTYSSYFRSEAEKLTRRTSLIPDK